MTSSPFPDQVPLSRARADLGPLVRWVDATRSRVAITSHGRVVAAIISATELAELLEAARQADRTPQPTTPPAGIREDR
jgi:prevent-host-death family protein